MSLSDQIDHLTRNAKSIKALSAKTATTGVSGGPFTRAVLSTPLGDLIREIDPSELGLFTLQGESTNTPASSSTLAESGTHHNNNGLPVDATIKRVEFHGATPLRRRDNGSNTNKTATQSKVKEIEPEVYAEAALKYLDRYEPIRPMPRARAQVVSILEQIALVRENMRTLTTTLETAQSAEAPPVKQLADEEEKRVLDLQTRITQLKQRKHHAQTRSTAKRRTIPSLTTHKRPPKPHISAPRPQTPDTDPQGEEETFWSTPAPSARVLRFGEAARRTNLMDESMLADSSILMGDSGMGNGIVDVSFGGDVDDSFDGGGEIRSRFGKGKEPEEARSAQEEEEEEEEQGEEVVQDNDSLISDEDEDDMFADEEEHAENDDGEKTVVLPKKSVPLALSPSESPSHGGGSALSDSRGRRPEREEREEARKDEVEAKTPKVRITNEVERIVSKIWITVGDIIMPGHHFDTSPTSTANSRPPRAKETIAHLHKTSNLLLPSFPSSPSSTISSLASPTSASPTSHQILTAHLLLSLLLSHSNQYSLSLSRVKEVLGEKAGVLSGNGGMGTGTTRPLYGCVAKKLLRIERGGGEQVVRFDL